MLTSYLLFICKLTRYEFRTCACLCWIFRATAHVWLEACYCYSIYKYNILFLLGNPLKSLKGLGHWSCWITNSLNMYIVNYIHWFLEYQEKGISLERSILVVHYTVLICKPNVVFVKLNIKCPTTFCFKSHGVKLDVKWNKYQNIRDLSLIWKSWIQSISLHCN